MSNIKNTAPYGQITDCAEKLFGHSELTSGQSQIIPQVISGKDVLALMPTGSGKSLCFQVPATLDCWDKTTLVVSPLISLMNDQVAYLNGAATFSKPYPIPSAAYHSHLSDEEKALIHQSMDFGGLNLPDGRQTAPYCLLYVSPEQLQNDVFRNQIAARLNIARLIVDEAHCISEWGPDFRPDYLRIADFASTFKVPQTVALTATASQTVRRDICNLLKLKEPFIYHCEQRRENLDYKVINNLSMSQKKSSLLTFFRQINTNSEPTIVYCSTIKNTHYVANFLAENGINAATYNGQMDPRDRQRNQEAFMQDEVKVLVATSSFGMGVNKKNVRNVIHFNMPGSVESYLQESGRAGRDGEPARCILLAGPDDIFIQKSFHESKSPDFQLVKNVFNLIVSQVNYHRAYQKWFQFEDWRMRKVIKEVYDKKADSKNPKKNQNLDTLINSSLHILENASLIERHGDYMRVIGNMLPGSGGESIISRLVVSKRENMRRGLEKMQQYLTSGGSQDELLRLLEE